MAGDIVADAAHELRKLRNRAEDLDTLLIEQLANICQLKTGGIALDQPAADPVFQAPQRIADAGLLEIELLGGPGDALHLGNDNEGSQEVPVELPDQPVGSWRYHS